jgi:hypothetical protein
MPVWGSRSSEPASNLRSQPRKKKGKTMKNQSKVTTEINEIENLHFEELDEQEVEKIQGGVWVREVVEDVEAY